MNTKKLTEINKEKNLVFKNRAFGEIKVGTRVAFHVENEDQWAGNLEGILVHKDGEFQIQTQNSGLLTIDHRYDVYGNTIRPV